LAPYLAILSLTPVYIGVDSFNRNNGL
jgi:hypothetical protein